MRKRYKCEENIHERSVYPGYKVNAKNQSIQQKCVESSNPHTNSHNTKVIIILILHMMKLRHRESM